MSLSVLIKYKDPSRPDYFNGVCPQSVLRDFWWPTAERLHLPTLERLEVLSITERSQAEALVRELRTVQTRLQAPDHLGEPPKLVAHVLERLLVLLPVSIAHRREVYE